MRIRWPNLKGLAARYPLVEIRPPTGVEVLGFDLTNGKDVEPVRYVVIGSTTEEEWHADGRTELREQRRRQSEEARTVTEELDSLRRQRASAERQLEELRERARQLKAETGLDLLPAVTRLEAAGGVPGGMLRM